MKYKFGFFGLLLAASLVSAQEPRSAKGPVSDGETAIKIAEAALIPVYGKKHIRSEEPFVAELKDDIWAVHGTLRCPDGKGGTTALCVGGVAMVKISKADGRIISMVHGK